MAATASAGSVKIYQDVISGPHGIVAGPDKALWFTNYLDDSIGRITTAGQVTTYTGTGIRGPQGIAAGPDGALWFNRPATPPRASPRATSSRSLPR